MSREIIINKYEGNTHYSITIVDSFGQEHHVAYEHELNNDILSKYEQMACDIWANEEERQVSSMDKAIAECVKLDKQAGITSKYRDCLD
tara:strand:+ start:132 stop:398 length:267 start_codon:yes stop_codon:yes gene_type:complete